MRAVRFHEYGGPEVLRYEACDEPGVRPGNVLVQVEAAGVNPIDWEMRAGIDGLRDLRFLPAVPGTDFSGRVIQVGSGVRQFIVGDLVFGQCELTGSGSYAEAIQVRSERLALIPPGLGFVRAASLPTIALAAWRAMFDFGELVSGQRVLIAGVAGCVGLMAAQLARFIEDVQVVGLCHRHQFGRGLEDLCSELLLVDDRRTVSRVRGKFDLVVNLLGVPFEVPAIAAAKRGGRLITSAPMPDFSRCWARSLRAITLSGRFSRQDLEMVARLVSSGQIILPSLYIEHLSDAQEIHRAGEDQQLHGKAVLVTD